MQARHKHIRTGAELFAFAYECDLYDQDRKDKARKHLALYIKPRAERCLFDVILPATKDVPERNLGSVKCYAEAQRLRDGNV